MAILVVVYLNVKQNKLPFIIGQESFSKTTFNGILNAVRTLVLVATKIQFQITFSGQKLCFGIIEECPKNIIINYLHQVRRL